MAYDSNDPKARERNRAAQRKWYLANKAKQVERSRIQKIKNRERNRKIAMNRMVNGCVDCSEKNYVVLEFHHVGEKLHNISHLLYQPAGLERLMTELEKCIILCRNCHTKRTAQAQGWDKCNWDSDSA